MVLWWLALGALLWVSRWAPLDMIPTFRDVCFDPHLPWLRPLAETYYRYSPLIVACSENLGCGPWVAAAGFTAADVPAMCLPVVYG